MITYLRSSFFQPLEHLITFRPSAEIRLANINVELAITVTKIRGNPKTFTRVNENLFCHFRTVHTMPANPTQNS